MKRLPFVLLLFAFAAAPLGFRAQAAQASLEVAEAKLGKGVENREITEPATTFAVGEKVFLWLKVTGGPSDPIKVTWKLGEESTDVSLNIGGNPWRTWSTRTVSKAGAWTVTVTDAAGRTLKEMTFNVQ
jgi:hypothetical protein